LPESNVKTTPAAGLRLYDCKFKSCQPDLTRQKSPSASMSNGFFSFQERELARARIVKNHAGQTLRSVESVEATSTFIEEAS